MQYNMPTIDPAVNNGTDLASYLNQWKPALHSNHSGAAQPTYVQRGMIWVKTTSTEDSIYYHTGTDDVLLFTIDVATGTITTGGGGSSNGAITFKGAIDPTTTAPTATNGDYYISNTAGIIDASFVGIAGETGSATDVLIFDGAFWSRIANTIDLSGYLPLGGGTMTGPLILSRDPVDPMEAATRQFVLAQAGGASLLLTGGTLTGPLVLPGDPSNPLEAAPKQYVDAQDALLLPLAGGTMTGPLILSGAPTMANGAATKNFVENWHDTSKLDVAGGTMTGPLLLSGNATANLEPVTYQQFLLGIDSVQVSTGSPSGNKLVMTNAVGKIDNSLLSVSTGFTYGGQLDPTDPAPANINGNYYIVSTDGVVDSSYGSPLAGTSVVAGDVLISNGTTWELSPVSQAGGGSYLDRDALNLVGTNFELLANYSVPSTMISGGDPDLAFLANLGIPGGIFGMPNNKVGLIYSDASGGLPSVSDLSTSCLGFNRADLKLYGLDSADTVQSLIAIPTFTATGMYGQNDLVMHNDRFLQARAAISAGAMDAAQWHDITPGISEYSATAVYMQDELVSYAGGLYKCLADNTGPETFTPANWESIDSSGFSANLIENGTSKIEIASANGPAIATINGVTTIGFYDTSLYSEVMFDQSMSLGVDAQKSLVGFANPFTGIAGANMYYRSIAVGANGGFSQDAFGGGTTQAFNFVGNTQTPTTDGSLGVFVFNGNKSDGATGATLLADSDDLFNILNRGASKFLVKGNGDTTIVGDLNVTGNITGGIATNSISNGTSDVTIPLTDGDIELTHAGLLAVQVQTDWTIVNNKLSLSEPTRPFLFLKRPGVTLHPFAIGSNVTTDLCGFLTGSPTTGGVTFGGYGGGTTTGCTLNGASETPTTDGSNGCVKINGSKSDGLTGTAALADGDDLLTVKNYNVAKLWVKGNGDTTIAGDLDVTGTISGTLAATGISNGTSNISIHVPDGNIAVTSGGNNTVNFQPTITQFTKTIQINSDTNQNITRYSADVTQPFTALIAAGYYALEYIGNTTQGGQRNHYYSDAAIPSLEVLGYQGAPGSGGSNGVFKYQGHKHNGSGGYISLADAEDLFNVLNNGVSAFLVKGNGDCKFAGQVTDYTIINAQTGTSYAPILTDANKMITMTNAADNTVTIPANASVAFPIGTRLNFMQTGAGQTTIAITTDTLSTNDNLTLKLNGLNAVATAIKISATVWILFGNLEPA